MKHDYALSLNINPIDYDEVFDKCRNRDIDDTERTGSVTSKR
jgi:hypothetical protein